MRIVIDVLDKKSIQQGINDLKTYKKDIKAKMDELCYRLAQLGATVVSVNYGRVNPFVSKTGSVDYSVEVDRKGNRFTIRVSGEDVLFLEYGSGDRYGWGHPDTTDAEGFVTEGADAPYGPGTYSPAGHWDDPNGWYVPGTHGRKSYGNYASAGMYNAKVEIEEQLKKIAEEIFNG